MAPLHRKIPKKMREALENLGYNPDNHRSQGVSVHLLDWADIIVCMGNVHEQYISTHYPQHSNKVRNWQIKDPHFATGTELHRQVAGQIQQRTLAEFC